MYTLVIQRGIVPPMGYIVFTFNSVVPQIPPQRIMLAALPFVGLVLLGMAI